MYQWRSSAPKSVGGGGAHKIFPENQKKNPNKQKVTAA